MGHGERPLPLCLPLRDQVAIPSQGQLSCERVPEEEEEEEEEEEDYLLALFFRTQH